MVRRASSTSTRAGGLAGRPPLTSHMRNELRQKMKKEEAIERLMTFFPKVTHDVAKHTLKYVCPMCRCTHIADHTVSTLRSICCMFCTLSAAVVQWYIVPLPTNYWRIV